MTNNELKVDDVVIEKMNESHIDEIVVIEKMNESHIDQIVEIENKSFSVPWSKVSFQGELKNPNAHYFVAKVNDKVVGYGGFWYIVNEGHITNIAVDEDYRGKKIGTKILNAMINSTEDMWIIGLTLEVRVSNEVAINFYKGLGFVEEGVRKNYYENKEDAIIMWLNFE